MEGVRRGIPLSKIVSGVEDCALFHFENLNVGTLLVQVTAVESALPNILYEIKCINYKIFGEAINIVK